MIAGNWKCNMRLDTAFQLAGEIVSRANDVEGVEKVVCPPFIYLATVETALTMSTVRLGAQDVHWEDDVAATGEIGPRQLEELCDYVLIGHSERRHAFGETDEAVKRKVKAALEAVLLPIMCVGETLEEREAGRTEDVLLRQIRSGLEGIDVPETFVIAYEPVWAIGTGQVASPQDAADVHRVLRATIGDLYDGDVSESVRLQYGGSVKAKDAPGLFAQTDIDGGLIGGASLDPAQFKVIVRAAAEGAPRE